MQVKQSIPRTLPVAVVMVDVDCGLGREAIQQITHRQACPASIVSTVVVGDSVAAAQVTSAAAIEAHDLHRLCSPSLAAALTDHSDSGLTVSQDRQYLCPEGTSAGRTTKPWAVRRARYSVAEQSRHCPCRPSLAAALAAKAARGNVVAHPRHHFSSSATSGAVLSLRAIGAAALQAARHARQ